MSSSQCCSKLKRHGYSIKSRQTCLFLQCRKVKVKQIPPGAVPPSAEECDFWYDLEHDRRFFTFTDSLSAPPASKEQYKGLSGRRVRDLYQNVRAVLQHTDVEMDDLYPMSLRGTKRHS